MEGTKKSTWVAGTVLLAVAILALSWFVLIAPVVDETATAVEDTQTAEDRNTVLAQQLSRLKTQYEQLPQLRAERDELAREIPASQSTSDFLRLAARLAEAAGTTIVDVAIDAPVDVLPAVPLETAPTEDTTPEAGTSEGAAAEGTTTDGQTADGTQATESPDAASGTEVAPPSTEPAVIPGFVAVPVSITVLGNVAGGVNFLGALQHQEERLFLVTALDGAGQDESEAEGARPATVRGDLELIITGYVYVLVDDAAAATDGSGAEGEAPATPPAPSDGTGSFSTT